MATRVGRKSQAPPPEPVPEPEPEKVEPETKADNASVHSGDKKIDSTSDGFDKSKCPEKIIERIIICPGGQDVCGQTGGQRPRHFHPPPPPELCPQETKPRKKSKKKNKKGGRLMKLEDMPGDGRQEKPVYPRPKKEEASPPQPAPTPVIIYHVPIHCSCQSSSEDSDDEEEEDNGMIDTTAFISFANMVFAAANVMSDCPDAY